jgi:tRNA-dihydrouridine synthase B
MTASLTDPWMLGPLEVPNRVMLAPLAGIGNWFVRLQAKRYGAGMAVSEMVSSHAIHYGNEKTCVEMLRIHPDERIAVPGGTAAAGWAGGVGGAGVAGGTGGPVSIQLFGEDPAVMRSAAAHVAATTDADAIDINMGCPVPKVRKTGAGAALLSDPDLAVAIARAAREGAEEGGRARAEEGRVRGDGDEGRARGREGRVRGDGDEGRVRGREGRVRGDGEEGRARVRGEGGMPITVKLRSGLRPGDTTSGFELAHRLVAEAGVAAIAFHPRCAAVQHKGVPDYELAVRLVRSLPAPVILTGGLSDPARVREAFERTGASAVMLARGALGNPWLFEQLLGTRAGAPTREEVLRELHWTIDRAVEHLGEPRATRYLRKFYPWYVARLDLEHAVARDLGRYLQTAETLGAVRALLGLGLELQPDPAALAVSA